MKSNCETIIFPKTGSMARCEMIVEGVPHPDPDEALRKIFIPGLLELHKQLVTEALEKDLDSIEDLYPRA